MKVIRSVSRFITFHVDVQFQHHLLKKLPLLHCIAFVWGQLYLCGPMSGLCILFQWSICSFTKQQCPHYFSFIVKLEDRLINPQTLLFFNIILAILDLLLLHINFRISLLLSIKWPAGILIDIALNLQLKLGRTSILTILCLPILKKISQFI